MTKVDKIYQEEKEEAVEIAKKKEKIDIAKSLLGILSLEIIAEKTGLSLEEVEALKVKKS